MVDYNRMLPEYAKRPQMKKTKTSLKNEQSLSAGGLWHIENGKAKLVSDDPIAKNNRLVNIYWKNGNLLIETENNGFYVLENNVLSKWDIPSNKLLSEISVFRSIQLKDGSFILGTRSDGILHLTSKGEVDYSIDVIH